MKPRILAASKIHDKAVAKAKEFAESASESAKVFGNRFKDEDVKDKFRDVGKAAEDFGKSVADCFKKEKGK